jgi:hypothetical protein
MSGRSGSGEKCEGSERNPFVWFVCKMLLTFFTVIAVDLVAVSLLGRLHCTITRHAPCSKPINNSQLSAA